MSFLTLLDTPPFTPRALFGLSTIGAIYAYDDFSYLYQKSDGSTPVTALEQPVGFRMDERYGGARGDQQVTDTASFTLTGAAGKNIGNNLVAGRWYAISMTVSGYSGTGDVGFDGTLFGATTTTRLSANGTVSGFALALASNAVRMFTRATNQATFSAISVRELPGLHAYQATDAARPVLKGTPRYANFDGTDDRLVTATGGGSTTGFLLVTGINVGGAGTARTIFSDRGTNTGYKVEVDAANNLVFTAGNGASFVSCTGPAITAGTSYVIACWHDGTNLNIKVGSGAVTSQAFATASAGTAAISIGRDNGAATGFYNGRLYPTVYIKDSTAGVGAINATMAWVAGKGGIAL